MLLLTVLAALALPAAASADPVRDCAGDGDLDRRYSNSQLRRALDNIPGELDEYSNCREVIKGAISSGSDRRNDSSGGGSGGGGGGGGTGGGGGGESAISADEQQAQANDNAKLDAITGNPDAKPDVNVGGEQLQPGADGLFVEFDLASASNSVPMPLLLALITLGVLALAGAFVAVRDRVPGLARIPLVSKIPRVSLPRFRR